MRTRKNHIIKLLTAGLSTIWLVSCGKHNPPSRTAIDTKKASVLALADTRPVASIEVADSDEIDVLAQQLGLKPIRAEGSRVFFVAEPAMLNRLRKTGYTITSEDPLTVYRRVVRVAGNPSAALLKELNIQFINRPPPTLIVSGSLAALKKLADAHYEISSIASDEPRPRQIRITVPSKADGQIVAQLQVDIYSEEPQNRPVRPSGPSIR